MKLAAAQINTRACDVVGNIRKIEEFWNQAEAKGVELVVTPEQSISGYPLDDMAANPDVLDASKKGLEYLIEKSKGRKTAILIGLPEQDKDGKIYNASYIIDNGECVGKVRKQHLPNYDVFDEKRIYAEGPRTEPIEFRGQLLGVPICEDGWHPDVIADLVAKGAQAIIWPNASPFYVGKHHDRIDQVLTQRIVREGNNVPVLYVNQVGGQDEVVFDGYSTAMNADGKIVMMAQSFEESLEVLDLKFSDKKPASFKKGNIHKIDDRLEETWNALVLGLRDYIGKSGVRNKKALLGMSGGIDSGVVAALAVDALGPENVMLYKLPSQYSSDHSITDSDDAAKFLGCGIEEIAIQPSVEALLSTVKPFFNDSASESALSLTEENIQARLRGVILMALSNANGGLLLSTGNKSEVSVGYCTLYGDMNGGFNPLKDVPKMLVYALAEWRNKNYPRNVLGPNGMTVPQNIIDKKPSAELRPGQVDEESLPPYPVLDDILQRYVEQEQSIADIVDETGYERDTIEDMIRKTDLAEFKRRQACPGIKITPRSFGKGRRVPISRPNTANMQRDVQQVLRIG